MSQIEIIKQQDVLGQSFRIYGTVDEPLFLARDVAEWIEHSDVSMMLRSIDEDEKLNQTMFVSGQNRLVSFVTEDGLYELLMQSRKPIAKAFKKEVKKILKDLRLYGQYKVPRTYAEALRIAADQQAQLELQKPKVDFFDQVASSKDAIEMGDVAKVLNIPGIGRNKLFEILRNKKILQNNNVPYQKYCDAGYFRVIEQKYTKPDGSVNINIKTLVYQKGLVYIRKVLEKE
jgi:phage antirepressor YoqD-like protein